MLRDMRLSTNYVYSKRPSVHLVFFLKLLQNSLCTMLSEAKSLKEEKSYPIWVTFFVIMFAFRVNLCIRVFVEAVLRHRLVTHQL